MSTEGELAEAESPVEDIEERLRWLENKLEGARQNAKQAVKRVNELEKIVEQQDMRNRRLVEEIADLRERTRLLHAVDQASSLKKDQRVATMVQTLYHKARRRQDNGADGSATATMDINGYLDALGGDVDQSYFYRDANAAVEKVGDERVLKFARESPGSRKNSRLILNLENGDLPNLIAGRDVIGSGNQGRA